MQLVGRPFGLPRIRHRGFVFTVGVGRENRNQSAPSHFQPRLGMKPAIGPLGPPLSSDSQRSVLVVDDDPDMCWILKVTIEMLGRSVTTAQSGRGALDVAHKFVFPLAFIDARLPDMDGLQLATKMVNRYTMMRIIIISGYYSEDDISIVEARQSMRVHGFLAKPFQLEAIEAALEENFAGRRIVDLT